MTPNPQDSAVALEVERAIREALMAGPTPGPWLAKGRVNPSRECIRIESHHPADEHHLYQVADVMDANHYQRNQANLAFILACNPESITSLLAEIDRLRASQSDGASGGWLEIASAPKDGTGVLLTNGKDVSQGWWVHEEPYIREQRDAAGVYLDKHDGFDGWMDCDGGMQPGPTHWMPLPAAPTQGENHVG